MKNYAQYRGTRQLDLAYVLMMQGRLVDAEIVCREALDLTLKVFDRTSVDVAMGLNRLAYIIAEQGRPAEAVLLADRVMVLSPRGRLAEISFQPSSCIAR